MYFWFLIDGFKYYSGVPTKNKSKNYMNSLMLSGNICYYAISNKFYRFVYILTKPNILKCLISNKDFQIILFKCLKVRYSDEFIKSGNKTYNVAYVV